MCSQLSCRLVLVSQVFIVLALGKYELAQAFLVELHALELKYDRLANNRLFLRVAHSCEQRVLQALLKRDSEVRVEHKDLLQEIDCLRRRARVFL